MHWSQVIIVLRFLVCKHLTTFDIRQPTLPCKQRAYKTVQVRLSWTQVNRTPACKLQVTWQDSVPHLSSIKQQSLKPSDYKTLTKPQQSATVTVLPAVWTPQTVFFPLHSCPIRNVCLCCMTLARLRLQWTETSPLALWPRWGLYSEAIYTHPTKRNSILVFPT